MRNLIKNQELVKAAKYFDTIRESEEFEKKHVAVGKTGSALGNQPQNFNIEILGGHGHPNDSLFQDFDQLNRQIHSKK